ncbi:DUF1173 domain-containing protein [Xanthomonas campestris]|uniref:DUF1173 domain-containing protein n=1 Tax=Xanthomonas campestris TaxID=339 RepID=UPI002B233EC5|nr:DUF1173 domain-containing protein [Xanthomonas campestris]MEA9776935.1 DUF1173 domain-containing protein [Xanthomonas campestris pv. raphani]
MSDYQLNGQPLRVQDESGRRALAAAHAKHERPLCLCRRPPVQMYIAKAGEAFIVKRMPNTGPTHDPGCESYEPPAELSGLGQVMGSAIKEDVEAGETTLKLAFSMSKGATRAAPVPSDGQTTTVKSDGTKLTLRSLLHYLWDEAGFNRWTPAMEGKRSYGVVRYHLLNAANNKSAKGAPLAENLFIPERFNQSEQDAITRRTKRIFKSIAGMQGKVRKLLVVIAEVKAFGVARYGNKVTFKHLPGQDFYMDEKFFKKLEKNFASELDMWNANEDSHLMLVGTFSVSDAGAPSLEEAALMPVTAQWIPYESSEEFELIEALRKQDRKFMKGLRYNLANDKPLASVVTNDTIPAPVAMYLVPAEAPEESATALVDLVKDSKLAPWFWHTDSSMPELPARVDYTPMDLEAPVASDASEAVTE